MQCILNKPAGMFDFYFSYISGMQLFNNSKTTAEIANDTDHTNFLNFHDLHLCHKCQIIKLNQGKYLHYIHLRDELATQRTKAFFFKRTISNCF